MSESQSRYSIVERLTQMKLDIISEKLDLEADVKQKQQKVEQLKKSLPIGRAIYSKIQKETED